GGGPLYGVLHCFPATRRRDRRRALSSWTGVRLPRPPCFRAAEPVGSARCDLEQHCVLQFCVAGMRSDGFWQTRGSRNGTDKPNLSVGIPRRGGGGDDQVVGRSP